jgi:hypothetical protein
MCQLLNLEWLPYLYFKHIVQSHRNKYCFGACSWLQALPYITYIKNCDEGEWPHSLGWIYTNFFLHSMSQTFNWNTMFLEKSQNLKFENTLHPNIKSIKVHVPKLICLPFLYSSMHSWISTEFFDVTICWVLNIKLYFWYNLPTQNTKADAKVDVPTLMFDLKNTPKVHVGVIRFMYPNLYQIGLHNGTYVALAN